MNITRIKAVKHDHAAAANSIVQAARAEGRTLTPAEQDEFNNHLKAADSLEKDYRNAATLGGQLGDLAALGGPPGAGEAPGDQPLQPVSFHNQAAAPVSSGRSAGELFVASRQYKDLQAIAGSSDSPWSGRHVVTSPVKVNFMNALVTGSSQELLGGATTSAGTLVRPLYGGFVDPTYARELTVKDLLTTMPVGGDTVQYVRVSSVTNAAAAVEEATSSALPTAPGAGGPLILDPDGGYKPESSMTFSTQEESIRTIAHWLPVTRKALSDALQIQTIIDVFLRYGLDEEVEDLILTGNGVGENLLGVANQAGTQTEAGVSGDTIVDKARRAILKSKLSRGGSPTAFVMHPEDWMKIELLKDAEERYFAAGAFSKEAPKTLWRIPVVEAEGLAAGTAWVANWRQGVYFDRQVATVSATDSHADFFIRNLVAILAELRGGFALLHPSSFVDFTVAAVA